MGKFKNISAESIITEQGIFGEINAKRYNGLPTANEFNFGVVKLDGTSIKLNEDGTISAQLRFEDKNMNEHIANTLIHISEKDRENLETLGFHINNKNIHLTSKEQQIIKDVSLHMKQPHLTEENIDNINSHLNNSNLHFDSIEQKENFIDAMNKTVSKKQEKSFKILITDINKNVVLSEVDSTVLEHLAGIKEPIQDVLERYAEKGHTHDNILTREELTNHTGNNEVHFTGSEKQEIKDSIDNLNGSVIAFGDSLGNVYGRMNKMNQMFTQRKLKIRYIRDTLFNNISEEPKDLSWVNCAIYKDGKNIALELPVEAISTDEGVSITDEQRLAYINGNTDNVVFTQSQCTNGEKHFLQIDLGSVVGGITHVDIRHKKGESYEMLTEVSEDGEVWIPLYDTYFNPMYEEDEYGKTHIINFEAFMKVFTRI